METERDYKSELTLIIQESFRDRDDGAYLMPISATILIFSIIVTEYVV